MAKRPWDDITGLPDGWEPVPPNHPGQWKPPPPLPPRPAAPFVDFDLPPDPQLEPPPRLIGERDRDEVWRLRKDAANRLTAGGVAYYDLHRDRTALIGIMHTVDWIFGTQDQSPIRNVSATAPVTTSQIRTEAYFAETTRLGGKQRLGYIGSRYARRTLRWILGRDGATRPIAEHPVALPADARVGVRTASDVRALAETFAAEARRQGLGKLDRWTYGAGSALLWVLGETVVPPMMITMGYHGAVIGSGAPDTATIIAEAHDVRDEIGRLGPGDGDMAPMWFGAQETLAWLCGETEVRPELRLNGR